jgi:predicted alpha/beta-fold hydrolase
MINEEIIERKPLVIGIGGLLDRNESGRVSDLLRILHNDGFATYNVYFSGIVRDESTIICNFSLDYVNDIKNVIKTAQEDERADSAKTGIIATSMGAAIFSYYLAQNTELAPKIKAYATISPFAKVNQHPQLIKMLEHHIEKEIDLEIGTPYDKQNRIKRIIPHKNIKNITSIDINKPLKACQ